MYNTVHCRKYDDHLWVTHKYIGGGELTTGWELSPVPSVLPHLSGWHSLPLQIHVCLRSLKIRHHARLTSSCLWVIGPMPKGQLCLPPSQDISLTSDNLTSIPSHCCLSTTRTLNKLFGSGRLPNKVGLNIHTSVGPSSTNFFSIRTYRM